LHRVGYYRLDEAGKPRRLSHLTELEQALQDGKQGDWSEETITEVCKDLEESVKVEIAQVEEGLRRLRDTQHKATVARVGRLLLDAALASTVARIVWICSISPIAYTARPR